VSVPPLRTTLKPSPAHSLSRVSRVVQIDRGLISSFACSPNAEPVIESGGKSGWGKGGREGGRGGERERDRRERERRERGERECVFVCLCVCVCVAASR
jgi:hypothetical protein